jgi:CO dehydrogenase maturation factor
VGKVVAISGKGGVGKTTFTALIIKYLRTKGKTPILAVDADPSTNLNILLGMDVRETIGGIREEASLVTRPPTVPLSDFLDYRIQMSIVEGEGVDLLAMGRPEGKGCYCAANTNLRESLKRLSSQYRYIIIDNEAGIEHISRQTDTDVDVMFVVSDPTPRGILTAKRIRDLAIELENEVRTIYLVLNRVDPERGVPGLDEIGDLPLAGIIYEDPKLGEIEMEERPIFHLDDESPSYKEVGKILESVGI